MDTNQAPKPVHPLRAFRQMRGMSQDALANVLGCSQTLVCLIESGHKRVSLNNAADWESKTGIPRMALLYPDQYPVNVAAVARAA